MYNNCRDCRTSRYTYRVVIHLYIYSLTVVIHLQIYRVLILRRLPGIEHSQQLQQYLLYGNC